MLILLTIWTDQSCTAGVSKSSLLSFRLATESNLNQLLSQVQFLSTKWCYQPWIWCHRSIKKNLVCLESSSYQDSYVNQLRPSTGELGLSSADEFYFRCSPKGGLLWHMISQNQLLIIQFPVVPKVSHLVSRSTTIGWNYLMESMRSLWHPLK